MTISSSEIHFIVDMVIDFTKMFGTQNILPQWWLRHTKHAAVHGRVKA